MPEPGGGTRIEGYFDSPRLTRYLMRVWLGLAVLIGTPIFILSLQDVITGSHNMSGDLWVGVLVPPALVFFGGVLLPTVGQLLGRGGERFIRQYVCDTLVAHIEEPSHPV
jgi:hypothetical protein